MNFEEWYLDNQQDAARDVLLGAFEAGAQSKQAKIDQLNKKNSEEKRILHNVIEMNQSKIDELQARVDEALHAADESCGVSVAAFVKLNRILKGNKDEN